MGTFGRKRYIIFIIDLLEKLSIMEERIRKKNFGGKVGFSTGLCGKVGGKPGVFNNRMWKTMWKCEKDTEEGSRMGYSQLTFCCPYYESNGKRSVHCEGGRVKLPTAEAEKEYIRFYCADHLGWKRCTVARAITRFYERVFEDEEG